jgi:TPR repeat protein
MSDRCHVCKKKASTRCTGCYLFHYCSKECQKKHWRKDHSRNCEKAAKLCKLCKEHDADSQIERGICSDCGELFCGTCAKTGKPEKAEICPVCKVPFMGKDPEIAFQNLLKLEKKVDAGDKRLQRIDTFLYICIGGRLLMGEGVEKNKGKAIEYYRKKDSALANFNLFCVTSIEEGAIEYLVKSVKQGYCKAKYMYALYLKTKNDDRHTPESIKLIKEVALTGHPEAEHELGLYYHLDGEGEDKDIRKAKFWYERAAEKNNPDALNNLGIIWKCGLGVIGDLTKAKNYFERAHFGGCLEGTYSLATIYEDENRYPEAIKLYQYLACKRYGIAFFRLGLLLLRKTINPLKRERLDNIKEGLVFLETAVKYGCGMAHQYLSELKLHMGDRDPPHDEKIRIWEEFFEKN